jgi:hypothetical protein
MRGGFMPDEYEQEIELVRRSIQAWAADDDEPHWGEYLAAWR